MRYFATFVLAGVLVTARPWGGGLQDGGQTSTDPLSQVDALLARWVQPTTPGAAVVVIRHGQVLLEKGYGLADVAARVPDHRAHGIRHRIGV